MIGYEARARLTTDVAGFVAGQRSAAQAAAALASSVQTLNTQLMRTYNLSAQAESSMKRIGQTANQTGQSQRSAASSASVLNQAMQQGAAAYAAAQSGASAASAAMERNAQAATRSAQTNQRNSQSLQAMGRELDRLRATQERYQALIRTGATLNRDQQESYNQVNRRLGELTQQYIRLDSTQRQQVKAARELAQANRLATQGIQEQSAAQVRLNQTSALTASQLSQMGREVTRLTSQRNALEAAQRQGVVLNQQEVQSLGAIEGRLRELAGIYARLSAEQKQAFTTARQLAQANQAVASSTQQAATASRDQERAAQDLNRSHWSMRSAVGDVAGAMSQLASASQRTTRALWENYSAQEMAIAQLNRVADTATSVDLDRITTSLRTMSEEIPIAFAELGEIAKLGSQVGVANDSLGVFTETVALFAATSEVSADQTASMMARIMEMTKLNDTHGQQSVQNLGSAIAYLGSNALATDAEILKTVESIATMTTQVGFSAEATIGLGTAMASLVIRPEIARGASQRVFLQLGEAIEGTGSDMERLVDITGRTQDELIKMKNENFEQYFFTVMEALSGVAESGEDLIPIVRELGIINTRDAEVVARLAANYDVLTESVDNSHEAFNNGRYLHAESERIFNTLTARVGILSNTWSNFLFSAVEAIAPFITRLVDGATAAIRFMDSMNAAPLVGVGASLLAIAGTLAVVGSGIGFAVQGWLSLIGAVRLWQGTAATAAAATARLSTAQLAEAAATGRATATRAAYQVSLMGTVTTGSAAIASTNALALAKVNLATRTAAATAALRAFAVAHPVATIVALGGAIFGAVSAWRAFTDTTEASNRALLRSQEEHINAAGGVDALSQAIKTDTQLWTTAREEVNEHVNALGNSTSAYSSSAEEIIRSSRFRTQAISDLSEADAKAAEDAENLAKNQQWLKDELDTSTQSAQEAGPSVENLADATRNAAQAGVEADNSIGQLNGSLQNTTEEVNESVAAIGLATRQWAALSLESAILESDLLANEEAFKLVQEAGVDFSRALTMEMKAPGEGVRQLQSDFYYFYDTLSAGEKFWANTSQGLYDLSLGFLDVRSDAAVAGQAIWDAAENLEATTLSIEEATRAGQSLDGMFVELPNGVRASQEELAAFAEEGVEAAAMAQTMELEVGNLGIALQDLHEGYTSLYDPVASWNDALTLANEGLEDQYGSLLEIEGGFSLYLDQLEQSNAAQRNWSENLLRLGANGDIPSEVIAGLVLMGEEGAEIVEGLANANEEEVQRFVESWDNGMGLTSELFTTMFSDFLSMAMTSGDQGGLDFAYGLMDRVAQGDIDFREAVDEMTTYAEDEFQGADTTNEPELDNVAALKQLLDLVDKVEQDTQDADATVHPRVDSRGFWKSIGDWFADAWRWWQNNVVDAFRVRIDMIANQRTGGGRGYADGGWIEGEGGPRADKIPIMASNKEFMVNAASAARWGPLLEWINSDGRLPSSRNYVPQIQPDDNMRRSMPTGAARVRSQPDFAQMASSGVRSSGGGERIVLHINNHYPQAEPTSVTTNRALQYVAGLNGVL